MARDTDERGQSEPENEFEAAFDLAEASESVVADPLAADNTVPSVEDLPPDNPVPKNDDEPFNGGASADSGEDDEEATFEQRYKSLQGIFRHDRETWNAEKLALQERHNELLKKLEESVKAVAPPAAPVKAPMDTFIESLTPEQKEQFTDYEKEYEVISRMEGLKRQTELDNLRKELGDWKTEVMSKLTAHEEQLVPVVDEVQQERDRRHFRFIEEKHPDYEQYRDDGSIENWISSKPKYLQSALSQTYDSGSAEDVVELISDFKKELDINLSESTGGELEKKRAQKKQALKSVGSRRGPVNLNQASSDDFEAAFDEAIQKI